MSDDTTTAAHLLADELGELAAAAADLPDGAVQRHMRNMHALARHLTSEFAGETRTERRFYLAVAALLAGVRDDRIAHPAEDASPVSGVVDLSRVDPSGAGRGSWQYWNDG